MIPTMEGCVREVAEQDVAGLIKAQESYGDSWKKRGGVGAFMMLARKWDRLENRVQRQLGLVCPYDIFGHVEADTRAEGVIDDVRDLRRYLCLVEAELIRRGAALGTARDNLPPNF